MSEIILYYAPFACSRVAMTALEEAGINYTGKVVNIFAGEQKTPEYLKINRYGQVPVLVIDEEVITENSSILMLLDQVAPEAELLPRSNSIVEKAKQRSDLIWCSAGIHQLVRQVLFPMRFTDGDPAGVYKSAVGKLRNALALIETRLQGDQWWYDDKWSVVDVYLNWCCLTAAKAKFPLADFPAILHHSERVQAKPSFQKTLETEKKANIGPPPLK